MYMYGQIHGYMYVHVATEKITLTNLHKICFHGLHPSSGGLDLHMHQIRRGQFDGVGVELLFPQDQNATNGRISHVII